MKQPIIPTNTPLTEEDWNALEKEDSEDTPSAEELREARRIEVLEGSVSEEDVESPARPRVVVPTVPPAARKKRSSAVASDNTVPSGIPGKRIKLSLDTTPRQPVSTGSSLISSATGSTSSSRQAKPPPKFKFQPRAAPPPPSQPNPEASTELLVGHTIETPANTQENITTATPSNPQVEVGIVPPSVEEDTATVPLTVEETAANIPSEPIGEPTLNVATEEVEKEVVAIEKAKADGEDDAPRTTNVVEEPPSQTQEIARPTPSNKDAEVGVSTGETSAKKPKTVEVGAEEMDESDKLRDLLRQALALVNLVEKPSDVHLRARIVELDADFAGKCKELEKTKAEHKKEINFLQGQLAGFQESRTD